MTRSTGSSNYLGQRAKRRFKCQQNGLIVAVKGDNPFQLLGSSVPQHKVFLHLIVESADGIFESNGVFGNINDVFLFFFRRSEETREKISSLVNVQFLLFC